MGEKEQGAARESNAASESERKSGSVIMSDREAEGGVAAADLDDDGAPEAAHRSITKSRSNIKNNREAGSGGPSGAQAVQYNESEMEFRKAGDAGGSGAAEAGPIRLDPTPARVSQGGGNDIAIGDPGVNGN